VQYLPSPSEKINRGFMLKTDKTEEPIEFQTDPKKPFIGYAFKLEENKFGQLTYIRVY